MVPTVKISKHAVDKRPLLRLLADRQPVAPTIRPDELHTASEVVDLYAVPRPLPSFVTRQIALGDALGVKFNVDRGGLWMTQWNGFVDTFFIDVDENPCTFTRGGLLKPLRLAQGNVLYKVTHEVAHSLSFDLVLGGLWGALRKELGSARRAFRRAAEFSEFFAGYMTHYELGANVSAYWAKHWPPLVGSAGAASAAVGLRTSRARYELMARTYGLAGGPVSRTLKRAIARSDLLRDVLVRESTYHDKVGFVADSWWKSYWSRPDIARFFSEFVPDRRLEIALDGRRSPLVLRHSDDVIRHGDRLAYDVSLGWIRSPREVARRVLQRQALVLLQTLSFFKRARLRLPERKRMKLISATEQRLASVRADFASWKAGHSATKTESSLAPFAEDLEKIVGEAVVVYDKSVAFDDWMLDARPVFSSNDFALDADVSTSSRSATVHALLAADIGFQRANTVELERQLDGARWVSVYAAAIRALGAKLGATAPTDRRGVRALLLEYAKVHDRFLSQGVPCAYRLGWMATKPYIDPEIGFCYG